MAACRAPALLCLVITAFVLLQLVHGGGPLLAELLPRDWARQHDWAREESSQQPQPQPQLPLPEDELQAHGTTTLAFTFAGGVLVAVDSRASIGKYVGSRTTRKVFPISSHMVATMAGGAADCTYWIRLCTRASKLHEYSAGAPLSVGSAATMLARRLREMRHAKLSVGTMVAGWDAHANKGNLYYVDSEGSCVQGNCFCVGSGANLAYSVLDVENDLEKLRSVEDAVELATAAIRIATARDGFSGGYINVLHINSTGTHHVRRVDSRDDASAPRPSLGRAE